MVPIPYSCHPEERNEILISFRPRARSAKGDEGPALRFSICVICAICGFSLAALLFLAFHYPLITIH